MKPLGRGQDKEFWGEVRTSPLYERYRQELLGYWEKSGKSYEVKPLTFSMWKLYWTTGDRNVYQGGYFSRRCFVENAVPLLLIYPEMDECLEKLEDVLFAMLDEYTWCLPAHQYQNERNDNTRLDLFASETGFYMALVLTLLGDRLSPVIADRIRVELDRRVFVPFIGTTYSNWWEGNINNWCAVCTGSIACAMMLARPDLFDSAMEERVLKSVSGYIDGFAEDGVCTEGCGYWAYGMNFYCMLADMLKNFTDGRIDLFKGEKMRAIATFPQKMFLSEQASVSFADGPRLLDYSIGVLHRLKDEYPEDVLIYSPDFGTFDIGCGRLAIRLYNAIWMKSEYWFSPADSRTELEEYAENTQWLTKRCAAYGFAAKAGHNDEMHNHNDVGSFIFAREGRQLLCDLGSGTYTRDYFSGKRYEILEPSSRSHSVPIIDGEYQFVGREAAAKDVKYSHGCFVMDISGAYKTDKVRSLLREFKMTDDGVTVTDRYDFREPCEIVERLVSEIEPSTAERGVVRIADCTVGYDADICTLSVSTEECTSEEGKLCYLIDFKLNAGTVEFKLDIK